MELYTSVTEQLLSQTKPSVLLDKIEFKLNETENNLNDHKQLKHQYHFLKPDLKLQSDRPNGLITNNKSNGICNKTNDDLPSPKHILCPPSFIQLEWKQSKNIGAGYMNLGNSCFMNSVLQALTYCPPLVNYLLYSNIDHQGKCKVLGLCMTCELIKHMRNSFQSSGSVIRPQNIFQRLKSLAKQLQPGRQEDSHEFLRYVIDNIWKSCIINWESSHGFKLDSKSKETTFINQIFGGYHRSQVTCLNCKAKSDTYDHFMDFILDIKAVSSLEGALKQYIEPEILRNDNAYKCSKCNKKVAAEKRFSVHKAPNVATFQLKRFDYNRIFGGKITKSISYPENVNLRPYMSENKGEPIMYKLFAVLVHLGSTSNSGHYFCYVRNSNNNWYLMDDARVSLTNLKQVLDQQAYILFYVRVPNKQSIDRTDLLKTNSFNHQSDKQQLSLINNNNNSNKLLINHNKNIPNGLMHNNNELDIAKKLPTTNNNLPKLINDTVNGLKKPQNVNNNQSILSDIESKLNNLNKSSSTSILKIKPVTPTMSSSKLISSSSDNHQKIIIKRLVPYDKNSSSDEDSKLDEKSLLNKNQSNGIKKFKSNDQYANYNGTLSNESNGTAKQQNNDHQSSSSSSSSDEEDQCKNKQLMESVTKHLENHIQSNNEKDKKSLLNGFAKFAEELGGLFGETDVAKHLETMSKDKIEFTPEMKQQQLNKQTHLIKSSSSSQSADLQKMTTTNQQNNQQQQQQQQQEQNNNFKSTPSISDCNQKSNKSQLLINRTVSPMKMNGYLSNNYYQTKQAKLLSNSWIDQSPSKVPVKTSSIASSSSTNSINSTTEWQVIDSDSKSLKKHLSRRIDNSSGWEVADLNSKSKSRSSSEESRRSSDKRQKTKSNNNSLNSSLNSSFDSSNSNDEDDDRVKNKKKALLDIMERRFEKKLRKIEKKDKKKFDQLYSDQDALLALYVKMKKKYNKKQRADEERKYKKKHKKYRSRRNSSDDSSFHSSQEELNIHDFVHSSNNNNNNGSHKLIKPPLPPQKNGNYLAKNYNQVFNNSSTNKKDVKSELNEMHLNLLGKNVNTWDGKKTQIDREVKEDLERDKKKSKDDLYNEEYDKGKTKKVKLKLDDHYKTSNNQNQFQKIYNERHLKEAIEKNKFIKSL